MLILETSQDQDAEIREEVPRGLVGGPMDRAPDRLPLATRAVEDGDLSLPFRAEAIRILASLADPAGRPVLVKAPETGPRPKIESPPPNATEQQARQALEAALAQPKR